MKSQKLEQILEFAQEIDLLPRETAVLYTAPIKIFDLPDSGMSLHIHGSLDGNYLYGGSFKEMGTNRVLRCLNGYECSMFDHIYGHEMKLPNKLDY